MTLLEFLTMWQADGAKFIEEDRHPILVSDNGHSFTYDFVLYSVYNSDMTQEYGRHWALFLVLAGEEIMGHELTNIQSYLGNYRGQVEEWWQKHIREGVPLWQHEAWQNRLT